MNISNLLHKRRPSPEEAKNQEYNHELLIQIQPQGNLRLNDERYIKTGDGFCSCIQIYRYPNQAYDFWLDEIMNIDDVISMLDIGTADRNEAQKEISASLTELDVRFAQESKAIGKIDAEQKYDLLNDMLVDIKVNGEVIKLIMCRLYVFARTREEVDKKVATIIKELEAKDYHLAVYLNETEFQYKALFAPYDVQKTWRNKRVGNPITTYALAGGYPFNYEQLSDEHGMYIGRSETGGNIIFDLFEKTKQRLSYDALVIGKKGSGKSTLLKLLLSNNAIIGNYIRTIDVTGEFSELAKELGGTIVTLDGKEGIINCLEVFKTDEDERTSFSLHLSKLNTFYRFIAPNSTEDVRNEFEEYVRKLYTIKGLWNEQEGSDGTQKITGLSPEMYPTFSELLDLIRSDLYLDYKEKKVNDNLSPSKQERLESIELTINNLVQSYGKMFDGYTTLPNLSSQKIIIYNVQNIANMKEEIFNAMLFNVLSLMLDDMINVGLPSKQMFEAGKPLKDIPKLLLIIDEAHKIISTKNALALDYMLHIVREGRKYFTGLAFASQSLRDYAPENSGTETVDKLKTLFEMLQYKFIMQQDANSQKLMRSVFEGEFTESQLQMIPKFQQGETLLSIGGSTLHVNIEVTEEELALFKGGA